MQPRRLSYEQIADDISERILTGEYRPGDLLPSKSELASLYGVSAATIDKVHIILRERRLTRGVSGRGVYVELRREWRYPYV